MKRAKVKDLSGVLVGVGEFEDPTEWLEKGKAGNWWGKPERWVFAEDLERLGEDQSKAIAVDVQTDLDQPIEELRTRTRYKFAAEYTIAIEPMDAEIAARLAEKKARNILRKSLKALKEKKKSGKLTAAEVGQGFEALLDLADLTEESES